MKRFSIVIGLCFLTACDPSEESEFQKAQTSNTIDAYQQYLKDWPGGKYQAQANESIDGLLYKEAQKADTIESYTEFLTARPDNKYRQEAQTRLDRLESVESILQRLTGEDDEDKLDG